MRKFIRGVPFILLPLLLIMACSDEDVEEALNNQVPIVDDQGMITDDDALWDCARTKREAREGDVGLFIAGVTEWIQGEFPEIPGPDIYVSPEGNDDNAGNSADVPLKTLAAAVSRVRPGQTIHLLPGTWHEGVVLGAFGDSSAEIVIRGEGSSADQVILDGDYWRSQGIGIVESQNIRIENLTIQHFTDAGIWVLSSKQIKVRGVHVRATGRCSIDPDAEGEGFGINMVGVTDGLVEDSLIEDAGPLRASVLTGEVLGTGINTFQFSGVIRNNTIRKTRGGGILVEDGGPATVEGNLVEDNWLLAANNYWDAGIWIDGSVDVVVRGNTFRRGWGGAGIMVSDEDFNYPKASKGVRIEKNTIEDNWVGVLVWGYKTCPPPADVILNYDTLTQDNTISGNSFRGEDRAVWCGPDFIGGELP